jgi:nucleotide-binding universal stress UspA family protein
MVYLRKILITTDMSQFSLAALEYALSLGLIYNSRLFLLHVLDGVALHRGIASPPEPPGKNAVDDVRHELEEFVRQKVGTDKKLIPVVRTGVAAEEIRRFAEEEGVDLIVIATHGRTGLKHMVLGSVAEKVVRLSPVPVLTVKPPRLQESIIRDEDIEKELHLR